jgi:hypothetical protein
MNVTLDISNFFSLSINCFLVYRYVRILLGYIPYTIVIASRKCRPYGIINMEAIAVRLQEAKALYHGEWIAFRSSEETDNPEGEVVLHNKDRRGCPCGSQLVFL